MIAGIASTPTISRNNQSMLSRGCELAVPVPLLFGHAQHGGPIGDVVYMSKGENQIYIRAVIRDHEAGRYAWQLIRSGKLSGLSCGFHDESEAYHVQAEVDGVKFYDVFRIREVSIVHQPANPDCRFHIYSAGTATESLSADELDRFWSWYEQELRVRRGECVH